MLPFMYSFWNDFYVLLYGNVLKNYMLSDWSAKTSDQTSKEEEKK